MFLEENCSVRLKLVDGPLTDVDACGRWIPLNVFNLFLLLYIFHFFLAQFEVEYLHYFVYLLLFHLMNKFCKNPLLV